MIHKYIFQLVIPASPNFSADKLSLFYEKIIIIKIILLFKSFLKSNKIERSVRSNALMLRADIRVDMYIPLGAMHI